MVNEMRIKLSKTDKLCHVTDEFRRRPRRCKKTVLGIGRTISIRANVNSDKFKTLWEEMAFEEIEGEAIGLAHL